MGLTGIDLVDHTQWETVRKYGLVPAMTPGAGTIPDGFNRKENHAALVAEMRGNIERAAAAKVPNVITFSGYRRGMPDDVGKENTIIGLNQVKKMAEDAGVTVCMELLNSKIDHHDYMCDHTAWGVRCQGRGFAPGQIAVRHLPYADYGRRHHPHCAGQHSVHRAFSYRRRARTA